MHLTSSFALIAALASSFVVRADVLPSEPSPGSIYREGQTCSIVWDGDASSQTLWKNMNIQLMTGDNFNMIHVTSKLELCTSILFLVLICFFNQPLRRARMVQLAGASNTPART